MEGGADLLPEFEAWCRSLDLAAGEIRDLVATALELKGEATGSPDPTRWSAEDLTTVLTTAFPARVPLRPDEQRLVGPAMALYLSFLGTTGRWPATAVPLDSLTGLLEELTDEVPRAYGRGGAAVADPTTGDARTPAGDAGTTGDDVAGPADDGAGTEPNPFAAIWPPALGPVPELDPLLVVEGTTDESAAWVRVSRVWGWAREVLSWLGTAREVGPDGALREADAADLLDRLGRPLPPAPAVATDAAPLALLWPALLAAGFVEVSDALARPGARALRDEPDDAVVLEGLALHAAVVAELLRPRPSGQTRALVPALTLGALVRAAGPGGFTVPAGHHDPSAPLAEVADALVTDLQVAVEAGVLERRGDAFVLPRALAPAVPYAVGLIEP